MNSDLVYAKVTFDADDIISITDLNAAVDAGLNLGFTQKKYPNASVVLVAHMDCIITRIMHIPKHHLSSNQRMQLIYDHFPIGEKLNEDTHIFDCTVFENSIGQYRALIAAMPIAISEAIAETATKVFGSSDVLARLDTIENIVFNRYLHLDSNNDSIKRQFILFPQGDGLKILAIADALPQAVYRISNTNATRESALQHWLQHAENIQDIRHATILSRNDSIGWVAGLLEAREISVTIQNYNFDL